MNIRNQLLTVSLSISAWDARKQDKRATAEVAASHGTDSKVGNYHKGLLPGALEHEKLLKLRNEWRTWHYGKTLPWGDENGVRVLKSAAFLDYAEGFRGYKDQWDQAVDAFIGAYPALVAQAQLRLNTLFSRDDYPCSDDVRAKFRVRMETAPLPDADDFRIIEGIPPEEADRLVEQALTDVNTRLSEAIKDLWTRLHDVVQAMQNRLSVPIGEKGGKFHDTLVGNMIDLLEALPSLNVTNDPAITAIGQEMRALVQHGPDTLRTSVEAREATAKKAAALAKRMAQYV